MSVRTLSSRRRAIGIVLRSSTSKRATLASQLISDAFSKTKRATVTPSRSLTCSIRSTRSKLASLMSAADLLALVVAGLIVSAVFVAFMGAR